MILPRDMLLMMVIFLVGPRQALAETCPYTTLACYCFDSTMVCNGLGEIPPLETGGDILNITDITFAEGNVDFIPANSLPPNLVSVSLTSLPLRNISEDAFQQSSATLSYLTISEAKFNRLPVAFIKLDDLNHLNLFHTHIQDWDTATFENSANSLTNLALVDVGLTEWPEWFSLFRSIQVLDFSNNSIKSIPDNAFNFLNDTLLYLTLTDCSLTQLPKALSSLTKLRSLDLTRNILVSTNSRPAIEQIGSFPLAQTLQILQLKYSGLNVIPNLANLTQLSRVNLDYNQITNSISGSFSMSVTSLDLGYNNLPSVPTVITGMKNLTFLDLSFNNITSVSFDIFPLPLKMLDLSGNQITQLNDTSTKDLSELTYLYLFKNPITTIPISIFKRMATLQTFELDTTNLTSIPMGLILLTQIKTLSLRHISSLSCPCPTPDELVAWFTSLKTTIADIGVCSNGLQVDEYLQGTCNNAGGDSIVSSSRLCSSCLILWLLAYVSCL